MEDSQRLNKVVYDILRCSNVDSDRGVLEQHCAVCIRNDFFESNDVKHVLHSNSSAVSFGLCHRRCDAKLAGQLNT